MAQKVIGGVSLEMKPHGSLQNVVSLKLRRRASEGLLPTVYQVEIDIEYSDLFDADDLEDDEIREMFINV